MGHDEGLWVEQLMLNQEGRKKIYSEGGKIVGTASLKYRTTQSKFYDIEVVKMPVGGEGRGVAFVKCVQDATATGNGRPPRMKGVGKY
jgi:hypothetical protein